MRNLMAATRRNLMAATRTRSPDSSDEREHPLRRDHRTSVSYGRRIMKTYKLPVSVEPSFESMALDTPERAVVVTNADGRTIGVFVAPDEYNVLRSTYDLVKDPDGIARMSGSYEPKTEGLTLQQVFARRRAVAAR